MKPEKKKKRPKPLVCPSPAARRKPAAEGEGPLPDGVRDIAGLIRSVYVEDRSAHETLRRGVSYTYTPPRAYDRGTAEVVEDGERLRTAKGSVWVKLAYQFMARRIDPVDYIHRTFENSKLVLRRTPEPEQLLSEDRVAAYLEGVAGEGEEIATSLTVQCHTASVEVAYRQRIVGMDFVQSHATVLLDPELELSALFRYCLAKQCRESGPIFDQIAARFRRRAAVQFERNRSHYSDSWKQYLPADFVREAGRIYEEHLVSLAGGNYRAQ